MRFGVLARHPTGPQSHGRFPALIYLLCILSIEYLHKIYIVDPFIITSVDKSALPQGPIMTSESPGALGRSGSGGQRVRSPAV